MFEKLPMLLKPKSYFWIVTSWLFPLLFTGNGLQGSERASYLVFQLDNDLPAGTDRNYTNGARIAWLQPLSRQRMNRVQDFMAGFGDHLESSLLSRLTTFIDPDNIEYDWGTGLTQLMYTPQDPDELSAPPGQRPYAAWLGMEFSLHAKDAGFLSSIQLSVGTTGRHAYAQKVQEWIHRNISSSPIFLGWDSQVPAEITINLHLDRKTRFTGLQRGTRDWPLQLEGYWGWGGAAGNFRTNAYLGGLLRVGHNLPVQYVTPRIQLGSYAHELFLDESMQKGPFSLYAFAGVRGTWVVHDITLDGPLFRDYDSPVASKSWIGGALVGMGARWQRITLTLSRNFMSEEYTSQDGGHQFGSVMVSAGF